MNTLTYDKRNIFKKVNRLSRGLYKNIFTELFPNNKNRVELNLTNIDFTDSNSFKLVNNYLNDNGYKIHDYVGGYATKDGGKNIFKIGKLIKHNKYLLTNFRDCVYRQKIKLVISKHPYDIACASWGQDWDSCLNIVDGANKDSLYDMIIANTGMIAYTVSKTSNTSLGRCFIVPYCNHETGYFWLKSADIPCGLFPDECKTFLNDWLNVEYNEKYTLPHIQKKSMFTFPDKIFYNNGECEEICVECLDD